MNKAALVQAVAHELGQSKAAAERAVNAILEALALGLRRDGEVALVGFGTFRTRTRAGRTGRDPQTGAPLTIKPSKTVAFRAGQPLKAKLKP